MDTSPTKNIGSRKASPVKKAPAKQAQKAPLRLCKVVVQPRYSGNDGNKHVIALRDLLDEDEPILDNNWNLNMS